MLPISMNQPSALTSNVQPSASATIQVNGNISPIDTRSNSIVPSATSANTPLVSVSQEGQIESPFVSISQQASDLNNQNQQLPDNAQPVDQVPRQIRSLNEEQQNIRVRQDDLAKEERAIEQEINDLQRRELEINRKRFELQRQSSVGSIVNLQI